MLLTRTMTHQNTDKYYMTNLPFSRLRSLAAWSRTTENRSVPVNKEDLQWAVQMLEYLSEIMNGNLEDMEFYDEELPAEGADLSNEEEPL